MRIGLVLGAAAVLLGAGTLEAGTAPATGSEPTRVVARVNQVDLTYADLRLRVEMLEQERGPVPVERYGEILRALVREEILAQAAVTEGLERETGIQRRIEVARRQVLIEELLRRKVAAQSTVSEDETRKTYEANKSHFSSETVGVSHILVKTEAEAEAIQQELKAGKPFDELAKGKSQDSGSAEKGGDLGPVARGDTDPEFEAAAFALKEGEVSGVVKTQHGYHILKGGAHTTTVQPYEEVKGRLQGMLGKQKQRDALMATMADLEQRAAMEIFEDRLR